MREIEIPDDVQLVHVNGQPMRDDKGDVVRATFREFLLDRLCGPVFGEGMRGILTACSIKAKLDAANGVLRLDEDEYACLVRAVQDPRAPYDARFAASLLPFLRAITGE